MRDVRMNSESRSHRTEELDWFCFNMRDVRMNSESDLKMY